MIDYELEKIKKISISDLENNDTFKKIDELADEYHRYFYIGEAGELWLFLNKLISDADIEDSNSYIFKTYQPILDKLAWVYFGFLGKSDLKKLFENKLLLGVDLEINFINEIKILFMLNVASWINLKNILIDSLKNNLEHLGENILTIGDKEETSIIKNWLIDYDEFIDIKKSGENIDLVNYLNTNDNVKKLNKQDRNILVKILEVYNYLRFGLSAQSEVKENNLSREPVKLPGKEPTKKVFQASEIAEDIKPKEKQASAIEKLLKDYQKFEADLSKIGFLRKEFEKYNKEIDKLSQRFKTSKKGEALAVLIFICQNKLLNLFFLDNQDLLSEFKKYLSQKFSSDLINNIIENSTKAETVSLYLQFLLNEKLKLSAKDSGLMGMHLANIFKKNAQKSYFPIVYGDTNLEQFVWREIVEEAGEIRFK